LLHKVSEALIAHYNHGQNVWEMLPGVSKNLDQFKRAGFRLGIVTNSDESTVPTLRTLGLSVFFDFVINTANTHLEKPNPEIFRRALEAGNGVNPVEAAHIGDEIDADYRAPREIGMISFLIDRQKRLRSEDLNGVDRRCLIYDLSELHNLVTVKQ
jgi:FMN phosphatase YigB (HAD superfamily)